MLDRRSLLVAAGAAAAGTVLRPAVAAAPLALPPLPYAPDALAPTISARTIALHHGKHHKAYFAKLNELVPGTPYAAMRLEEIVRRSAGQAAAADRKIFNNAAQAWNHVAYFEQLAPGGPREPQGRLAELIGRDLGGTAKLQDRFVAVAEDVFGTGWVWLTHENDRLTVAGYADADSPLAHGKPALLGIDVWEHAYYLDYENRRADHVWAVLGKLVDWNVVESRLPS